MVVVKNFFQLFLINNYAIHEVQPSNRPNKEMPMSEQKYLSYTYLIGWSKQDLWYYGVRYAQVNRKQNYDLWTDYFTHSIPVKHMRAFIGEPDVIHYDKIFDSKEEAIKYERKTQKEHNVIKSNRWLNKNIGGCSDNTGKTKSVDFRNKMRKIKTGINHPMYNKSSHNSKKIIIDNKIYKSISDASEKLKINKSTIHKWLNSNYANYIVSKRNNTKHRKYIIKIDEIKYYGIADATKKLNVSKGTIYRWIKNGRAVLIEEIKFQGKQSPNKKQIILNNKIYDSISFASKETNISRTTLHKWIKKGKIKYNN